MTRSGGGRPIIESGTTLDIRYLTHTGLVPNSTRSGNLQWTWPNTGQRACHIEYQVTLNENTGILRLCSIMRFDGLGRAVRVGEQTIHLITTAPPYGGRRWWFICPSTGRRAMKLHLPYGAGVFASRQAHCLGYAIQREGAPDRARRRARKARKRIGRNPNLLERLPIKPKWMRWATYWRHVEACQEADGQVLKFLVGETEDFGAAVHTIDSGTAS
jgi:hypothetical protein